MSVYMYMSMYACTMYVHVHVLVCVSACVHTIVQVSGVSAYSLVLGVSF